MEFGTTRKQMAQARTDLALSILETSVFDTENKCSMCLEKKLPYPGPSIIVRIQCDSCNRWFHARCVQMDTAQLEDTKNTPWDCCLCKC
ncbi:hypothetical protein QQF64_028847 [Cirrhinus molitorella]|uniref:PHD-type domain-containing protein n=1 Tax=Cirrhinus molitorella TaxID=172907 RepID=A0ABR3N7T3_9TELE